MPMLKALLPLLILAAIVLVLLRGFFRGSAHVHTTHDPVVGGVDHSWEGGGDAGGDGGGGDG